MSCSYWGRFLIIKCQGNAELLCRSAIHSSHQVGQKRFGLLVELTNLNMLHINTQIAVDTGNAHCSRHIHGMFVKWLLYELKFFWKRVNLKPSLLFEAWVIFERSDLALISSNFSTVSSHCLIFFLLKAGSIKDLACLNGTEAFWNLFQNIFTLLILVEPPFRQVSYMNTSSSLSHTWHFNTESYRTY